MCRDGTIRSDEALRGNPIGQGLGLASPLECVATHWGKGCFDVLLLDILFSGKADVAASAGESLETSNVAAIIGLSVSLVEDMVLEMRFVAVQQTNLFLCCLND